MPIDRAYAAAIINIQVWSGLCLELSKGARYVRCSTAGYVMLSRAARSRPA